MGARPGGKRRAFDREGEGGGECGRRFVEARGQAEDGAVHDSMWRGAAEWSSLTESSTRRMCVSDVLSETVLGSFFILSKRPLETPSAVL